MQTVETVTPFFQNLQTVVWTVGIIGLIVGATAESILRRYGRQTLRALVPTLVAFTIVVGFVVANRTGLLRGPAVVKSALHTQDYDVPYCDGWLYYVDARCWAQ